MHIHDVLIIGGGPSGLAVAARLREHTPSATFTDDEHQRYHWIKKHGRKMNIKNYKTNKNSLPTPPPSPDLSANEDCKADDLEMVILDGEKNDWMGRWHRLFKTFQIDYLRSPMFFHVDPSDRDALLSHTYEAGRDNELLALPGCVGKEVSKHKRKKKMQRRTARNVSQSGPDIDERDRKDYHTPSTSLFAAHCCDVAERYGLDQDIVKHETALVITYQKLDNIMKTESDSCTFEENIDSERMVFRVATDKGTWFAHVVVLAIGPGNAPSIPKITGLLSSSVPQNEGYCHAMQLAQFPPLSVISRVQQHQQTNILIVGGGLTSIQLADVAIRKGVSKVWLLMRGPLKVKYFDLDLDWVGKFRNFNQASFWSADSDEERLEMLLAARNGGSITPRYRKILDDHLSSGRISLHTHTGLERVKWDEKSRTWSSIHTTTNMSLPAIDFIVFATGIQTDVKTIPALEEMQERYPIDTMGGLPCLNDDLMWCDDVPLFVTGRLAGLRLGPGAPNLIGARIGAERIAWNIEDVLSKVRGDEAGDEISTSEDRLTAAATGRQNRFDNLCEDSACIQC